MNSFYARLAALMGGREPQEAPDMPQMFRAPPRSELERYETKLSPEDEARYQAEMGPRARDTLDYDMRGWWQDHRPLPGGVEMREPYQSEADFFASNPNVAGMATEDNRVILNPRSWLSPREKRQVALNEAMRVLMRTGRVPAPDFAITDEQRKAFSGYGAPADIRQTIAARLISGDPSAGTPTEEQLAFAKRLKDHAQIQPVDAPSGHFTDTYKLPNHPTFSNQSKFHGVDGNTGGTWGEEGGQDTFTPSPTNRANMSSQELLDYFREVEPNAKLKGVAANPEFMAVFARMLGR